MLLKNISCQLNLCSIIVHTDNNTLIPSLGFPGSSVVKNLPARQDIWFRSLGQEDPLEKGMAARSSILAWEIPWTESLVGYTLGGRKESNDWHRLAQTYIPSLGLFPFQPPQLNCTSDPLLPCLKPFQGFLVPAEYNSVLYYRNYGSDGNGSTCSAGDLGSIPGLKRSPGEGNGNPFQESCLENSVDKGAWWAI